MFDDQTSSWPLFGDQTFRWLKPWPNGSNVFYQTSSNIRTQGVAQNYPDYHNNFNLVESAITHLPCASQTCSIHLAKQIKHHQTSMRTKEMFDGVQTRSNINKHQQTRWPNSKMFDHQTMFDDVWLSNISCLTRALDTPFSFFNKRCSFPALALTVHMFYTPPWWLLLGGLPDCTFVFLKNQTPTFLQPQEIFWCWLPHLKKSINGISLNKVLRFKQLNYLHIL